MIARHGTPDPSDASAPPLSEMGLVNQQLADVIDGLASLSALIASMSGGNGKARSYPRPETAMQRAGRRREMTHINSIVAAVEAGQERQRNGRE